MINIEERYLRVQNVTYRNVQGTASSQTEDIAFLLDGDLGDYHILEAGTYNSTIVRAVQRASMHGDMKIIARVKMEQSNGFNIEIPNLVSNRPYLSKVYVNYKDKNKVEEISNVIDFIELNSNAYSTSVLPHTSGERTSFSDYFKNIKSRSADMNPILLFYIQPKANVARVAMIQKKTITVNGTTSYDYMATIQSSVSGEDAEIDVDFLSHNLTDIRDAVK